MNINLIKNNSELLVEQVKGNIDVLRISETKTNNSFPVSNFLINGFCTLYRLDQNSHHEHTLLHVREDIPSNLDAPEEIPIETFFVESNLHKEKWLIIASTTLVKI